MTTTALRIRTLTPSTRATALEKGWWYYMRQDETPAESAVYYQRKFGHLPDEVIVVGRWNYMAARKQDER